MPDFFKEVLMSAFTKHLRTAALSAVVALTVAPISYAASVGGGFHGGGGSHGGFAGGGLHAGAGFHGGGFHNHLAFHDGFHRGSRGRYGYWQNGAWVDGWSPYCDPSSPLYDMNYCYYYGD